MRRGVTPCCTLGSTEERHSTGRSGRTTTRLQPDSGKFQHFTSSAHRLQGDAACTRLTSPASLSAALKLRAEFSGPPPLRHTHLPRRPFHFFLTPGGFFFSFTLSGHFGAKQKRHAQLGPASAQVAALLWPSSFHQPRARLSTWPHNASRSTAGHSEP
jgi:hypothetical protein